MKPNEIMIDDWVETPLGIGKVTSIDAACLPAFQTARVFHKKQKRIEYQDAFVDILKVQPVPLTDEILEENGFDCSDPEVKQFHFVEDNVDYTFSLRQMYNRSKKPDGFSFYAFGVLTLIVYVHELQHAMRLCGIEKEIEL